MWFTIAAGEIVVVVVVEAEEEGGGRGGRGEEDNETAAEGEEVLLGSKLAIRFLDEGSRGTTSVSTGMGEPRDLLSATFCRSGFCFCGCCCSIDGIERKRQRITKGGRGRKGGGDFKVSLVGVSHPSSAKHQPQRRESRGKGRGFGWGGQAKEREKRDPNFHRPRPLEDLSCRYRFR